MLTALIQRAKRATAQGFHGLLPSEGCQRLPPWWYALFETSTFGIGPVLGIGARFGTLRSTPGMPMNPVYSEWVRIGILHLFTVSCCAISSWLFHTIRLEVNDRLPPNEKISALFGYPGLLSKVMTLHRNFYPESRVRLVLKLFMVMAAVSGVTVAFLL